jgi:hypothetical protein
MKWKTFYWGYGSGGDYIPQNVAKAMDDLLAHVEKEKWTVFQTHIRDDCVYAVAYKKEGEPVIEDEFGIPSDDEVAGIGALFG